MSNKDIETKANKLHYELLDKLCRDVNDEDLKIYKDRLRNAGYGGFRAREIERMEEIRDIFSAQQKRGVFSVGKYSELQEQLGNTNNDELVKLVSKYERQMRDIGFPVISRPTADSMDSASPSETTPSSSADKPFRHGFTSDSPAEVPPGVPTYKEPFYDAGKGYVLYISNFFAVKPRKGVKVDHENITSFFKEKLGYDMDFYQDIGTPEDLWQVINAAKLKAKHSYSSFFFIISSHGRGITLKELKESGKDVKDNEEEEEVVITERIKLVENDSYVGVDQIVSKFEEFMVGKPKVLIFQACRSIPTPPIPMASDDITAFTPQEFFDHKNPRIIPYQITIPRNGDMVVIHDTSRGYKSWRSDVGGALLFNCMFVQLKDQYDTEHLLDVLTRVNYYISMSDYVDKHRTAVKEMPSFTSTFTKFFYLTSK